MITKDLALATGGVVVASILATAENVGLENGGRFALTSVLIMLGPVAGWILAWFQGALQEAWPLLALVTIACGVSVAAYIHWRSIASLVIASLLWLAAGYLFVVAVWI